MHMTVDRKPFMLRAIELARQGMNSGCGGPFGAVVVKNGKIIGEGWNRVLSQHDPTAHGEVSAIRDACSRIGSHVLEGAEIYTTGEPCPMCLGAIYWSRIQSIFYGFSITDAAGIGFDDREFYRQFGLPAGERDVPAAPLACEDARLLIEEYRALPNKILY